MFDCIPAALAIAITCASVALTEAGVEMLDLPIACSVVRREGWEVAVEVPVVREVCR